MAARFDYPQAQEIHIASKEAANRVKDRETLPRLKAFRDCWRREKRRRGGE